MSKLDEKYLKIAQIWSENSHSRRLKVGAIVVKNGMIISDGYNGTPSGFDNECEFEQEILLPNGTRRKILQTKPYVLHAEANAIAKLAKSTISSSGSTLYTLYSPCLECAKLIIQSEITRVVYCHEYRLPDGINLLKEAKVQIDKIVLK